jgi:dephospho-CoA kinase
LVGQRSNATGAAGFPNPELGTLNPELGTNPGLWPPLVVAGLTGGIASGKTTVARMLAGLGATVLNADEEGRAVVEPGEPALAEITAAFGVEHLLPDGRLDRKATAERIFSSRRDREILNRITHPRIGERLRATLRQLAARPPRARVVVVEAAVLIEAGWESVVDRIIVVRAQHSTQIARLMAGQGLSREQAEARVRSQLPLGRRLRHANYVIDGEAPLSETHSQVRAVWDDLRRFAVEQAGLRTSMSRAGDS